MAEFNIQSSSVDVTRIMEQIRQRIREKRGTDYTEQQTQELATVKLERFLDPRQVRSDLVEHYRNLEPPAALEPVVPYEKPGPAPEPFEFDQDTIYASSRGTMGKLIRLIRKLLNPILKLFINPNPVSFALTRQAEINTWTLRLLQQQTDLAERVTKQFERAGAKFAAREELDALNYEVLNNLVVEMSRLSVDMKNHRMLVESVAGRLDFDERRARALESVVQSRSPQPPGGPDATGEDAENTSSTGTSRPRRRRRRSRRRSGGTATPDTGTNAPGGGSAESDTATPPPEPAATTLPTGTAGQNTEPEQNPPAAPPPAPVEELSAKPPETNPSTSTAPSGDPEPPTPAALPQVADTRSTAPSGDPELPSPAALPQAADTRSPAPSGDPEPPTPAALAQVADTGSPTSAPAPSTPGPGDAPAPAASPATETVARPSPEGETGTDEQ